MINRFTLALIALAAGAALSSASAQTKALPDTPPAGLAFATFGGGCFWCVESDFDKVPGVVATTSGYLNGRSKNPGYREVSAGGTGHVEAVRIVYDPKKVSYSQLLHVFWRTHDPLTANAQFCDHGDQYRPAIIVHTPQQKAAAEASKAQLQQSGVLKGRIVTGIENAGTFYEAEDYHQDYYKKNATKYKFYRWNCGRDQRVRQLWGDQAGGLPLPAAVR